jgi:hypothetical protein
MVGEYEAYKNKYRDQILRISDGLFWIYNVTFPIMAPYSLVGEQKCYWESSPRPYDRKMGQWVPINLLYLAVTSYRVLNCYQTVRLVASQNSNLVQSNPKYLVSVCGDNEVTDCRQMYRYGQWTTKLIEEKEELEGSTVGCSAHKGEQVLGYL